MVMGLGVGTPMDFYYPRYSNRSRSLHIPFMVKEIGGMGYVIIIYLLIGFCISSWDLYVDKNLRRESFTDIAGGFILVTFLWPLALGIAWIKLILREREIRKEKNGHTEKTDIDS